MNESILQSIKHLLGIEGVYDHFDSDLLIHLNSEFFYLYQIGVTEKPFRITGDSETWEDFKSNIEDVALIKDLVYLRTKKIFDPPTSGILMDSLKDQIKEAEWRVYSEVDFGKENK